MKTALTDRSRILTPIFAIGNGGVLCLFLTRFFLVAESAGQGETLWIVALWLVALLIFGIFSLLFPTESIPIDWLDASVGLLVTGHVISAFRVVWTNGEKRSAINLAWEWIGVAIGWYLIRRASRSATFRRDLLFSLIACGTALSLLGCYQHYVEFPRISAKYGPLFDQLKHADPSEAAGIRQVLAQDQIPTEGPTAVLFENRLRESREPFALFALANTLGGFLAVCLVIAVAMALPVTKAARSQIVFQRMIRISLMAVIVWCLLLTKSRTAWIGTATGIGIWLFLTSYAKKSDIGGERKISEPLDFSKNLYRNRLRILVAIGFVLSIFGIGLGYYGGLDRKVLTEAPKSLQYRLQYWSATVPMIADHFWFGVGPGQFRTHYLKYKLAEASEEISDPHDLFLDAAANGGVLALAGLVALIVSFGVNLGSLERVNPTSNRILANDSNAWVLLAVASIAFFAVLLTAADDRLLALLPISIGLFFGVRQASNPKDCAFEIQVAARVASVALFIHLLGAGGMEMPAISLLLLVLVSLSNASIIDSRLLSTSRISSAVIAGMSLALLICLFCMGLQPVSAAMKRLESGDRLVERGQYDAADREYAFAASSDDFFAEPWRRRAELAYRKAEAGRFQSNELFLNAVDLLEKARLRDPLSYQDDKRLAVWWMTRWRASSRSDDLENAVAAYRRALEHHPTNAGLMADLAFTLDALTDFDEAKRYSEKALEQDRINRERGHVDRFLSDEDRTRLGNLLKKQTIEKL